MFLLQNKRCIHAMSIVNNNFDHNINKTTVFVHIHSIFHIRIVINPISTYTRTNTFFLMGVLISKTSMKFQTSKNFFNFFVLLFLPWKNGSFFETEKKIVKTLSLIESCLGVKPTNYLF